MLISQWTPEKIQDVFNQLASPKLDLIASTTKKRTLADAWQQDYQGALLLSIYCLYRQALPSHKDTINQFINYLATENIAELSTLECNILKTLAEQHKAAAKKEPDNGNVKPELFYLTDETAPKILNQLYRALRYQHKSLTALTRLAINGDLIALNVLTAKGQDAKQYAINAIIARAAITGDYGSAETKLNNLSDTTDILLAKKLNLAYIHCLNNQFDKAKKLFEEVCDVSNTTVWQRLQSYPFRLHGHLQLRNLVKHTGLANTYEPKTGAIVKPYYFSSSRSKLTLLVCCLCIFMSIFSIAALFMASHTATLLILGFGSSLLTAPTLTLSVAIALGAMGSILLGLELYYPQFISTECLAPLKSWMRQMQYYGWKNYFRNQLNSWISKLSLATGEKPENNNKSLPPDDPDKTRFAASSASMTQTLNKAPTPVLPIAAIPAEGVPIPPPDSSSAAATPTEGRPPKDIPPLWQSKYNKNKQENQITPANSQP